VSGIIPTLEANNYMGKFSQKVNDLSFALIPPLHTDDDDVSHNSLNIVLSVE
jgi:hypothetical protein